MHRLILVAALIILHAPLLEAQPGREADTIYVADRFLGDSAMGYHLFAKFHTAAARAAEFRLDNVILAGGDRVWTLGEIIVSADFDGNGYVASWIVAGPRRVVAHYVEYMRRKMADRAIIYDSGIRSLVVRCACD